MEPLKVITNGYNFPCGHKMLACELLNSDKIELQKNK
jgi:hypothetical protein